MHSRSVLIVGAGPGGTSAAISLSLAGFNVRLLESKAFPRDRPGETLHPGFEPLAHQLGVAGALRNAGFIRHAGTWVELRGRRHFEPFGGTHDQRWLGFQAIRSQLDAILLDRARAVGVRIEQPCRAHKPIVEKGRVIGVETDRGTRRSDWVIDAAGGSHWLARRLKIGIERCSNKLIARFGYASECPEPDHQLPIFIPRQRGWIWHAKIARRRYAWVKLQFDPDTHPRPRPSQCGKGADVTWRRVARPAGPGFFCVGDAACILDPASSHGVLRAVMSGTMAAHLIQTLSDSNSESFVCDAYTRWVTDGFTHDSNALRDRYRQFGLLGYDAEFALSGSEVLRTAALAVDG